jgi:chorismate-pyruvate lyase
MLAEHPGTVTSLLEQLAGEPVDADVLYRGVPPEGGPDARELGRPDDPDDSDGLVHRRVLLTGRSSGRRFVYAASTIAGGRLPGAVGRQLGMTSDPIGRVLARHGLHIGRNIDRRPLPPPGPGRPEAVEDPGLVTLLTTPALVRRYRLVVGDAPVMVVSEWFLTPVSDALSAALSGARCGVRLTRSGPPP